MPVKKLFLVIVSVLILLLGACNSTRPSEQKHTVELGPKTADQVALKVGFVTDPSGLKEGSFNQLAWNGMKKGQDDFGVKVQFSQVNSRENYLDALQQLHSEGMDLIWGLGFDISDDLLRAAKRYPDTKFGLINETFGQDNPPNLTALVFKEQEAAFLAGYAAGEMTETDRIGYIGGFEESVITEKILYGFKAGVKYANPDCKVYESYAETVLDPAIGKTLALKMYHKGADILFHAAGQTGRGVIEAAKDMNNYVIGMDRDQSYLAPEHVLLSAIKRIDNAIYQTLDYMNEGYWYEGATVEYGLADGGVGIIEGEGDLIPGWLRDRLEEVRLDIISGDIIVPIQHSQYEKFLREQHIN